MSKRKVLFSIKILNNTFLDNFLITIDNIYIIVYILIYVTIYYRFPIGRF